MFWYCDKSLPDDSPLTPTPSASWWLFFQRCAGDDDVRQVSAKYKVSSASPPFKAVSTSDQLPDFCFKLQNSRKSWSFVANKNVVSAVNNTTRPHYSKTATVLDHRAYSLQGSALTCWFHRAALYSYNAARYIDATFFYNAQGRKQS